MTPSKTPFAGYEKLAPGDPLSSDGFAFQSVNPDIADLMAHVGAVLHRHDAHAAMVDPTTAPVVTTGGSGAIPALEAISVVYTLLDAQGGETLPVAAVVVTTPGGYGEPDSAPTCVADYAAGTLLANTYSYAISVTDGLGGETPLGPVTVVSVDPGHANAEVVVSGLTAITDASSGSDTAAGWRLWRAVAGTWYLIATGAHSINTVTDSGIAGDCSIAPPSVGTTGGGNSFDVTVPSTGQPGGATAFNIYACIDGAFTSPCLLGNFLVADYDAAQNFTDLTVTFGEPPAVSRALPGASQIDPDTDILNWPWKRTVANVAALPGGGNTDGDVRLVLDVRKLYQWNAGASAWQPLGTLFVRAAAVTALTGLVATTETAETLTMLGPGMMIYAVTVDVACRVRLYPTAALATADIARGVSADPDVAAQQGCLLEISPAGAGTYSLTPTVNAIMQEGSIAATIAANVSVPAGTTVTVTLHGYRLE